MKTHRIVCVVDVPLLPCSVDDTIADVVDVSFVMRALRNELRYRNCIVMFRSDLVTIVTGKFKMPINGNRRMLALQWVVRSMQKLPMKVLLVLLSYGNLVAIKNTTIYYEKNFALNTHRVCRYVWVSYNFIHRTETVWTSYCITARNLNRFCDQSNPVTQIRKSIMLWSLGWCIAWH